MNNQIKPGTICRYAFCDAPATVIHHKGRIKSALCQKHFDQATIVKLEPIQPATTGSKYADKRVNQAVDMALLRLGPIIRDMMREEIKRHLELEPE